MNLTDKEEQLWKLIEKIGWIGKEEDGSISRLPASASYNQAAAVVMQLMREEGMDVYSDPVGNVHGTVYGIEDGSKTIMCGSHLDTVKNGGLFDGTLGISAAIDCVRRFRENGVKLRSNLEVVCFQGEEGSPLGGTFGSRSMMGQIDLKSPGYETILSQYGMTARKVLDSRIDTSKKKCFFELHIEQGKILESGKIDIGIVTGIVGITRYRITVLGKTNHAGTTPMKMRSDALVTAAVLIQKISEKAENCTNGLVATVGQMNVFPNAVTIIPGRVEMILEIRHMDQNAVDEFAKAVERDVYLLEDGDTTIQMKQIVKKSSIVCNKHLQDVFEESCIKLGVSYQKIASGAGHDGNAIGQKIPTAMIFVPSRAGLSHCKEEWTDISQALKGENVLYEAIKRMDEGDMKKI